MCLYTYVCVYGTLHWLTTCCCPGVQQWLYHAEKAQNPIVVQSVRVGVSSVPLWCWCPRGWHGELLLFSLLCWNPKEFGSNNSERISRQQDRWALYLRLRTSRHKWTFPSFSEFFLWATTKCDPGLAWVFYLQVVWLRNSLISVLRSLDFSLFQRQSLTTKISHHIDERG